MGRTQERRAAQLAPLKQGPPVVLNIRPLGRTADVGYRGELKDLQLKNRNLVVI